LKRNKKAAFFLLIFEYQTMPICLITINKTTGMKKMRLIIILLTAMAYLQACKKEPISTSQTTNWGYVKEFYTQKPIAQAMVVVYGKNPMWAVQDTLYTDSNGRYEFDYVKYLAELDATATGYIPNRMFTQDELVGRYNRTIYLYQPAEMMLHVKNVNPFNEYDRISLNDFFAPDVVLNGANVDTMVCCLTARRYENVGLKTVVRKNSKDSIIMYYHTPTKATGNMVDINY
jgi:hypothetical protein